MCEQFYPKEIKDRLGRFYKKNYPEEETLVFGNVMDDEIALQTPRQPSAVTVSKKILEHFPTQSWSWNSLKILNLKPESIQSLAWEAHQSFSAENQGNAWKSSQGEINMTVLNLQLKVLENLTAVRWIGAPAQNDFAKPLLTLTIKHDDKTDRLIFGKELDDDTIVAALNDEKIAFLLSKRDLKALSLSPKQTKPNPPQEKTP